MEEELNTVVMEETSDREGVVVYEIAFHVIPTTGEDEIGARAADVRAAIEDAGGSIIAEGFPTLMTLAYTIAAKGGKFDRAYFGWAKFEAAPGAIAAIKEFADTNASILRYLIIKTTRDSGADAKKPLIQLAPEGAFDTDEEAKAVVSEEELDKSLEGMIAE